MPTIEERLAALETKLAALTDTTPTTYYEHQYSGEEIDNAVARALPNGAIDQAAGTFVRPNLLDNWYFGRPVDQRKGYIQIGGTMMYKDPACTDQFGPSNGTTPVVVYATYARPIDHGVELGLYIPLNNIVRGYAGAGYAVDRWKMQLDIGIILLEADGIILDATANALTLVQFFESDLLRELAGNTLTWSVMYTILEQSGAPGGLGYTIPGNYYAQAIMSGDVGKLCVASGSISAPTNLEIPAQMYIPKGCKIKLVAAKLEIGPTQTLAHREGDRWVLNEEPEYGGQLRRCQRYYYQVHYNQYETIGFAYDGPEYAFIIIPLPTEMRGATPTLKIIGDISIGGKVRTLTGCSCHGCEAIIGVNYTAQPSSAGATYAYSTSAGGVTISIIYDL